MKFRLLQCRDPGDPVIAEERLAFATRLQVPIEDVLTHDCLLEPTRADIVADGVDAVLIGGSGAYSVYDGHPWLGDFIDTLGGLADQQTPTFASCFGFQALVVALGGKVAADEAGSEVGTYELALTPEASGDPVFGGLPSRFLAQEGHKDRALDLPSPAVLLAGSARCPYQAIRVGTQVYATQFHPELTAADNKARFNRYLAKYAHAFSASRAQDLLDAFQESPDTEGLLRRFAHQLGSPR